MLSALVMFTGVVMAETPASVVLGSQKTQTEIVNLSRTNPTVFDNEALKMGAVDDAYWMTTTMKEFAYGSDESNVGNVSGNKFVNKLGMIHYNRFVTPMQSGFSVTQISTPVELTLNETLNETNTTE